MKYGSCKYIPPQAQDIDSVCSSLIKIAERLCPALKSEAEEVARVFTQLFKHFQTCHDTYDSSHLLKDEEIQALHNRLGVGASVICIMFSTGYNIKLLGGNSLRQQSYTQNAHARGPHGLKMARWHGEQGAESNILVQPSTELKGTNMLKKVQRLKQLMKEHHRQVCPPLVPVVVKHKRRKTS